jgi:hypothetical protein
MIADHHLGQLELLAYKECLNLNLPMTPSKCISKGTAKFFVTSAVRRDSRYVKLRNALLMGFIRLAEFKVSDVVLVEFRIRLNILIFVHK